METGPHIRLVLWKAHKAVESLDRASIAATGLNLTDFAVLEAILHKGAMPVNQIGRKVLLTSGSISTAIDRLEKRGLVRRRRDMSDGRIFHVELTAEGREIIREAFDRHRRNLDSVVELLSAEERRQLVVLLKRLGYNAEKKKGAFAGR